MNITNALDAIESDLRELRGRPVRHAKTTVGGAGTGGGGGGIWVMSIVELVAGCACRVAWCLILRTPCGDNRWLPGDLVAVYDDIECVLNDTEDRLAGVKVIVSRTEGDAYTANALGAECNPDGYDPPEPGSCHFTFVRRCCLEPL